MNTKKASHLCDKINIKERSGLNYDDDFVELISEVLKDAPPPTPAEEDRVNTFITYQKRFTHILPDDCTLKLSHIFDHFKSFIKEHALLDKEKAEDLSILINTLFWAVTDLYHNSEYSGQYIDTKLDDLVLNYCNVFTLDKTCFDVNAYSECVYAILDYTIAGILKAIGSNNTAQLTSYLQTVTILPINLQQILVYIYDKKP